MRIILKILVAPILAVLTVLWAFLVFVFCWGAMILNIVSGLVALLAIILFFMGQITGGIVFIVIAFLISPIGLPVIIKWVIDRIGDLRNALHTFIIT